MCSRYPPSADTSVISDWAYNTVTGAKQRIARCNCYVIYVQLMNIQCHITMSSNTTHLFSGNKTELP